MPNINIDPSKLENILCPACGGKNFIQLTAIKYVPRLLSPNGFPLALVVQDCLRCTDCQADLSIADLQIMARDFIPSGSSLELPGGSAPAPRPAMKSAVEVGSAKLTLIDNKKPE